MTRSERESEELQMAENTVEPMDPQRPWATAYRPFRDADERIGAMRCGLATAPWLRRRCRNPSAYVSYGPIGRTVMCERCAEKMGLTIAGKAEAA